MFQAFKLNLKSAIVVCRLAKLTTGPLSYRVKVINKYYPIFVHHSKLQTHQQQQNIEHLLEEREGISYKNKIMTFYKNYTQKIKSNVEQKNKQIQQKDKSAYQKQVKGLLHTGMQYMSLYYQSLQNLIEGRREVMHDQHFKFEDGQSVETKRIKFQKFMTKLFGRIQNEVQSDKNETSSRFQEHKY